MNDIQAVAAKIGLPRFAQLGVVVRDVKQTVALYSSVFGISPFTVYEWSPDKHWVDEKPSPLKLQIGKAQWGDIELELIQLLEGKSPHGEFLEKRGEGLHHLGFNVSNYHEVYGKMVDEGFKPMMRAESYVAPYKGNLKACYFDTTRVGGIIFEIIWKSWLTGGQEGASH